VPNPQLREPWEPGVWVWWTLRCNAGIIGRFARLPQVAVSLVGPLQEALSLCYRLGSHPSVAVAMAPAKCNGIREAADLKREEVKQAPLVDLESNSFPKLQQASFPSLIPA